MSEQETHKLEVALAELAGKVDTNGKAVQMGFSEMRRELAAMKEAHEKHRDHCPSCEAGLKAEILANEREARKREQEVADVARAENRTLEVRVRALEKSRNIQTGISTAIGALAGALASPALTYFLGSLTK